MKKEEHPDNGIPPCNRQNRFVQLKLKFSYKPLPGHPPTTDIHPKKGLPVNKKKTDIIKWIISMKKGKYLPIDFTIENGFCEDFPGTLEFYSNYGPDTYKLRDLPSQKPKILKHFIQNNLEHYNIRSIFSDATIKRIENEIS